MKRIGAAFWVVAWFAAAGFLASPGVSTAAEHGGMQHGDHGGTKAQGHDHAAHRGHDAGKGEKIFSGKAGPWAVEARLVDMKAQMERSGVSEKTAAKFAGKRHLMLFLADPKTGKAVSASGGKVVVAGPGKGASATVALVVMGEHIGADVDMPTPGKYSIQAEFESGGKKGSAAFSYVLK